MPTSRTSPIRSRLVRAAAVPIAACVALGVTGCNDADSAGPDQGTTLSDLNEGGHEAQGADTLGEAEIARAVGADDTGAFYDDRNAFRDRPVTVSAQIVEVFSPKMFVIGRGDQATLVTLANPDGLALQPGVVAQVTGDVRSFVLADVERDLGIDLADDAFAVFDRELYVAATDVNLLNQD